MKRLYVYGAVRKPHLPSLSTNQSQMENQPMKTILCFTLTLLTFVTLAFVPNSFAQDSRPIVRLIYFVPSDRQPQPDIDTKFDKLIKEVQRGYEDIMEAHGFGKKTFRFETDEKGNAVVHTVNGQYTEKHYNDPLDTQGIWREIDEQFGGSKNFYLIAIDISSGGPLSAGVTGIGKDRGGSAGWALMPASGPYFNIILAAHELAHAFGLQHDYRPDANLVVSDIVGNIYFFPASFCAAEWLDVHRAFNAEQPLSNEEPTFDMLPPNFVSSPNVIHLRFKVTDHDGIHQVQLMTPERDRTGSLLACKNLNGNSSATVEFVTSSLTPQNRFVSLRMIDVHGNISASPRFPIDVLSLLPPIEVVSMPDAILAAAVRQQIGSITTHTLLNLTDLKIPNRGITDLTGLEHARNLKYLDLYGNQISDITPLAKLTHLTELALSGNPGADISSITELTQLRILYLIDYQIQDLTPFAGLTNLDTLGLNVNQISDITPLAALTELQFLYLTSNQISDITPLTGLTKLIFLHLRRNQINDITPLAGLTKLRQLQVSGNQISDITPLARLTELSFLDLTVNLQINDITPLAGLTELRQLQLTGNYRINDITPLTGLTKLRQLQLDSVTRINDITPLARLTELEDLNLWNNQISDITPLTGLTKLRRLQIGANQISDISPLIELNQLLRLYSAKNNISDISPLAKLTQLRSLALWDNQISDVTPLAELINLENLYLHENPIKNRKPLLELLRKNPDVKIYLKLGGEPLPVTLSHFRAEHTDTGVVLKWTTESEVDNAGFYIYRSATKDGEFKVVNPTMIQGAGTTGERNAYTWTDTTAKPNTVYYYQIEDVSHAGVRKQLATVRLRGLVSAKGKLTTRWADLKMQQ